MKFPLSNYERQVFCFVRRVSSATNARTVPPGSVGAAFLQNYTCTRREGDGFVFCDHRPVAANCILAVSSFT